MVLLHIGARLLNQSVVADAGGASRDAGHAAKAPVEVLDHGVGEIDRAIDEPAHEIDPAARRVHLLVPERVRRACRQAEAAVDAVGDQLLLHNASTTRSASGCQGCSVVGSATYATRRPGRTSGAAWPSQRTRPGSVACSARRSCHG